MSVCTLTDRDSGEAVFYCSTSGWAFGPVMDNYEVAEAFLQSLPSDPRNYSDKELGEAWTSFRGERVDERGNLIEVFSGDTITDLEQMVKTVEGQ